MAAWAPSRSVEAFYFVDGYSPKEQQTYEQLARAIHARFHAHYAGNEAVPLVHFSPGVDGEWFTRTA